MQHDPSYPPASIRDLRRDRSILALAAALCGALAAAGLGGVLVVHQLCTEHNASHIGEANADLALALARIDETRGELEQTRRELDEARRELTQRPTKRDAARPCERQRHKHNHKNKEERGTLAAHPRPASVTLGAAPPVAGPLTTITHAGITCPSEHRCQIHREVVDAALANPASISRGVRVIPIVKDGQRRGFRLYGMSEGSPLRLLGLTNGDAITSVDGNLLDNLESALMTYQRVRRGPEKRFEVEVERRGEALVKTYEIL